MKTKTIFSPLTKLQAKTRESCTTVTPFYSISFSLFFNGHTIFVEKSESHSPKSGTISLKAIYLKSACRNNLLSFDFRKYILKKYYYCCYLLGELFRYFFSDSKLMT